jgi:hypothetical protein
MLFVIPAKVMNLAFITFRRPRKTDIPAMKDKPVMGLGNVFLRDMPDKLFFYFQGGFAILIYKPEPFGNPENMGINSHCGLVVNHRRNNIGSFTSHTWQFLQFFDIPGK